MRSPGGQQRECRTHLSRVGACGERFAKSHRGHRRVSGGGEQAAHLKRVGGGGDAAVASNHCAEQRIGLRGVTQGQSNTGSANSPLEYIRLRAVRGIEIGKDTGIAPAHGKYA